MKSSDFRKIINSHAAISLLLLAAVLTGAVSFSDPAFALSDNTPRITGQAPLSVPEETSLTIEHSHLIVTVPGNICPADFTLTVLDGANYIRSENTVTPEASFNGELTVPVKMKNSTTESNVFDLRIIITPVNDAPVLDNSGDMQLSDIPEDIPEDENLGTLVSEIIASAGGDRITDEDADAKEGIAVIAISNTRGLWQYRPVEDIVFVNFPWNLGENKAVLLTHEARIRFIPAPDYHGRPDDSITFRAWDQTRGYSGDINADTTISSGNTAFNRKTETASVTIIPVNDTPGFKEEVITEAEEDTEYYCDIVIADPDAGDTHTLSALILPGWLTLTDNQDSTGMLRGIPGNDDVGKHNVGLEIRDSGGASVTETFVITVANVNDTPAITSEPLTAAAQDKYYVYRIITEDIDSDDTRTIIAPTLPKWLTLTNHADGTALLSGTPADKDTGHHPVELRVRDASGAAAGQSFSITVTNVNDAPAFTSEPLTLTNEGLEYSYAIATDDIDASDVLLITAADLPDWLTLTNNRDGTASIAGTPSDKNIGSHKVELQVTDAAGDSDVQAFIITVTDPCDVPVFKSTPVTKAAEDADYIYKIAVGYPDKREFLSLIAPVLPIWLTLTDNGSGSGTLTGKPGNEDTGSNEIMLKVKNSEDIQTFTIFVENVNDAPVLDNRSRMFLNTIKQDIPDGRNIGTQIAAILITSEVSDPISDEDRDAEEGIAVVFADNSGGTWQYDEDRNGIFTDFPGDISESSAVLLNDSAVIRFVPDPHFNGEAGIAFRAWDLTEGNNGDTGRDTTLNGGMTAFSVNIGRAEIIVTPDDDMPNFDSVGIADISGTAGDLQ
ncbi:Ig-like domain-containing protein [Desulfococcaceae bacterium HSG8]|nr:Ig-like domain-containing protein [Desulfococcaceae bacterium HSG8]